MTTDAELAAELRRIALTLHETVVGPDSRREALDSLRQAHQALVGDQPRLRWYEANDQTTPRTRNRELSAWSGQLNAAAPPMQLEVGERHGDAAMLGWVELDRLREGPPGCAHGGVVAGLFDEVMGAGQRLSGWPGGMTAKMTVKYRQPTPLGTGLLFRAWVGEQRSLRIAMKAECLIAATLDHDRPTVTAEAEAIFVRPRS